MLAVELPHRGSVELDAQGAETQDIGRWLHRFTAPVPEMASPSGRIATKIIERAVEQAGEWMAQVKGAALEAGARRLALTVGRALQLALLVRHAQWSLEAEKDGTARSAARRFAAHGVSRLAEVDEADSSRLFAGDSR